MTETNLTELRKQCVTSLYLCTENVSKYLDEDKNIEFEKLKSYVEKYCLLEAQQDVATQALEKAKSETDESNLNNLEDRFQGYLGSMADKRLNVKDHQYMLEINDHFQSGSQIPRRNLDESDLAITETQDQYIDPYTKRPILDPVKNNICGHIYEKESILNMIKSNTTKCPVIGCSNRAVLSVNNLVSDEELKFRIALTQHSTMIQDTSVMNLDSSIG